ncbi:malate synthase [Sporosarcina sp. P37]|uniref:malate synthase n=1 Tax=unclassified Sporosarcina TaxID=2647733 RepID=UPI000A17C335|nr:MULTISPECIES: malate synthase [unclassified Sporosarcina]ARK23345.1 malate synthase [Sporosarcina sp. P37]PID19598.1 malate synthase [Sporosarcina sp. P35]
MNLINEGITHNVFGEGSIVEHEDSVIVVDFNNVLKKFVYPDAFDNFITLNDQTIAKSLEEVFLKKRAEEAVLEKKRKEEKKIRLLEQQRRDILKNNKIHVSSQIVFWLDEEEQSNLFNDWQISTGSIQSGKNKGRPNPVTRLRPNSAGVLTVRNSDQEETERRIVGLFMVNDIFTGTIGDDGLVPYHEDFRIQLTEQEAEKMLFWKYYVNKNYPHRTSWNSGKFRYFDNVWTAQMLKDIIALRTDEDEVKEAEDFLEYFCKLNALDVDNIPEASGAIQ